METLTSSKYFGSNKFCWQKSLGIPEIPIPENGRCFFISHLKWVSESEDVYSSYKCISDCCDFFMSLLIANAMTANCTLPAFAYLSTFCSLLHQVNFMMHYTPSFLVRSHLKLFSLVITSVIPNLIHNYKQMIECVVHLMQWNMQWYYLSVK